jgi:hypothetical protein
MTTIIEKDLAQTKAEVSRLSSLLDEWISAAQSGGPTFGRVHQEPRPERLREAIARHVNADAEAAAMRLWMTAHEAGEHADCNGCHDPMRLCAHDCGLEVVTAGGAGRAILERLAGAEGERDTASALIATLTAERDATAGEAAAMRAFVERVAGYNVEPQHTRIGDGYHALLLHAIAMACEIKSRGAAAGKAILDRLAAVERERDEARAALETVVRVAIHALEPFARHAKAFVMCGPSQILDARDDTTLTIGDLDNAKEATLTIASKTDGAALLAGYEDLLASGRVALARARDERTAADARAATAERERDNYREANETNAKAAGTAIGRAMVAERTAEAMRAALDDIRESAMHDESTSYECSRIAVVAARALGMDRPSHMRAETEKTMTDLIDLTKLVRALREEAESIDVARAAGHTVIACHADERAAQDRYYEAMEQEIGAAARKAAGVAGIGQYPKCEAEPAKTILLVDPQPARAAFSALTVAKTALVEAERVQAEAEARLKTAKENLAAVRRETFELIVPGSQPARQTPPAVEGPS